MPPADRLVGALRATFAGDEICEWGGAAVGLGQVRSQSGQRLRSLGVVPDVAGGVQGFAQGGVAVGLG